MKIYRFIPNAGEYRYLPRSLVGKWWPDGIDLGKAADKLYPKVLGDRPYPWPHEGNRFTSASEGRVLPDFPALSLNVPILSERAVSALSALGTVDTPAELTIDARRFFAAQPRRIPGVFREEASTGLAMPNGEIFFYDRRSFDVSKVDAEFFMIDALRPFSDLYVTDRLVTAAAAAGLTGLEYLELVFDEGGPVVPRYPRRDLAEIPEFTGRRELEYYLIDWRCSIWGYDDREIKDAVSAAVSQGSLSLEYVKPTYER